MKLNKAIERNVILGKAIILNNQYNTHTQKKGGGERNNTYILIYMQKMKSKQRTT
jgi:hypothetical protein